MYIGYINEFVVLGNSQTLIGIMAWTKEGKVSCIESTFAEGKLNEFGKKTETSFARSCTWLKIGEFCIADIGCQNLL